MIGPANSRIAELLREAFRLAAPIPEWARSVTFRCERCGANVTSSEPPEMTGEHSARFVGVRCGGCEASFTVEIVEP